MTNALHVIFSYYFIQHPHIAVLMFVSVNKRVTFTRLWKFGSNLSCLWILITCCFCLGTSNNNLRGVAESGNCKMANLQSLRVKLRRFASRSCGILSSRSSGSLATVSDSHDYWYKESIERPEEFWGKLAKERLRWMKPFDTVMNCDMNKASFRWFEGGQLNLSGMYYVYVQYV